MIRCNTLGETIYLFCLYLLKDDVLFKLAHPVLMCVWLRWSYICCGYIGANVIANVFFSMHNIEERWDYLLGRDGFVF